jgi:hypothetical protein
MRTIGKNTDFGTADFAACCADCGTRRRFSELVEGGDGMYRCVDSCGKERDAVTISRDAAAQRRGPNLPPPGPPTMFDTEADS